MTLDNQPLYTGGCQCGVVRFRVEGAMGRPSICHCRMCQKAFGAFYAPLVNVGSAQLTWSRGEPQRFRSSNHASRGFCSRCGTPLTYETENEVALAIGAFDDPSSLAPEIQFSIESKIAFVDRLHDLPVRSTEEDAADHPYLADITSFQHPDHDMPGDRPGDARTA